MRVLIVAPYFPPFKGVGALRMASLTRYLHQQGIESIILTNTINGDEEIESTYYYVDIKNNGEKYYTRFIRNREGYCKRFSEVCTNLRPDVIVVSGGPFYTFEIAVHAKKVGIPCILDFRDPWIFEYRGAKNYFTLRNLVSKLIELPWERRAVHAASRVVTVTEGWKEQFMKAYPFSKNKFIVIENGYDDSKLQEIQLYNSVSDAKMTLAAFGKLFYYTESYSGLFLKVFKKFQTQINLLQVGQIEANTEALLSRYAINNDNFQVTGFIAYQEGIRQLNKADAFLLIDIRKNAIGTKIYDYIYINKPIIYVGPKKTVLARIISSFENGFVCTSEREVEEALKKIKPSMRLDNCIDIHKYSRSAQNQIWVETLYQLIGE